MSVILRVLPFAAGILGTLALGIMASGFAAYYYLQPTLPSVEEMRDIQLQIPLRIYSRDGRLISQIGEKKRIPVEYKNIPETVIHAFLAAEDDRFFEHPGFDYQGIVRAGLKLLMTGSRAQGGSTITQQLAREYFLTRDRTFIRKAKELILAIQIEHAFEKPVILSLYLNKIFLGHRSYGVAAAAEVYFGKTLDKLTIAEAATIAGLPAAPSRLNPVANPDQARDRRAYVLRRMRELDYISAEDFELAVNTPMMSRLHGPKVELKAPYAAEIARSEMVQRFGEKAYTDGYQVITTIDSRLQKAANSALRNALANYDYRHGYRGPLDQVVLEDIISEYQATTEENLKEKDELLAPGINFETDNSFALQDFLNGYPDYENISIAIVTSLNTETNGAEFYLRDTGQIELAWEQIKWKPYVNDNIVGAEPEAITDILSIGDVVYLFSTPSGYRLGQVPVAQAAFVALSPQDGATIAMSGGFDYSASSFNRASQTKRQPGSAFKPFIYSAALESGFTAATIVNDAPIVLNSFGQEEAWRPENYSKRFYGPSRLREGLVKSMNLVSIRILREIGLRHTLNHLQPFRLPKSALPRDLSLALGTGGTSPWQLGEAYTGFASGGYSVKRYLIDRIINAERETVFSATPITVCNLCEELWFDGREALNKPAPPDFARTDQDEVKAENHEDTTAGITEEITLAIETSEVPAYNTVVEMIDHAENWHPNYTETPLFWSDRNQAQRIISPQNAYIVYDMMRDVIKRGTGRRARELGRSDIGGKTGTSNNRRDAWFSGFNNELVGIAWVGFDDDSRSLGAGEGGGSTALPIWKNFMAIALEGTASAPIPQPDGIVSVRISSATGQLAPYGSSGSIFEIFRAGNEPGTNPNIYNSNEGDVFTDDDKDGSIF
ncbi:MAG: peptidase [Gammaproteobacteria bacterium]|nr:peptidase [Gammaproteobacteria bacterium]MCP4089943.1 peptidase [Gammaproteobacteria bacterium]MCP4276274.1 peptidase [Gammaproteobacteria bacterium]MCP4831269.1 peptidase [Gammaproteobacteria bacterium]